MMKIWKGFSFLILTTFCTIASQAQSYHRNDSILIIENNDTLINAWAGGINAPQFSEIDLNFDGIQDLFVFDKEGNTIKTFINKGTPNKIDYQFAPSYIEKFPPLENIALLRDFNCDGKADIFTHTSVGLKVYKNTSTSAQNTSFQLFTPLIKSNYNPNFVNLFVSATDLPSIIDVDNDGDLDILTFSVFGTTVEYHQNKSMELYGNCDSLVFQLQTSCWGNFLESGNSSIISLNVSCKGGTSTAGANLSGLHSGSSITAFDIDSDGDKEMLIGDILSNHIVLVNNGGDSTLANMITKDSLFPIDGTSVDITVFPSTFVLDVNNDGKQDVIAAPNSANSSLNYNNSWYYQNLGNGIQSTFNLQSTSFLQSEMVDLGSGANPAFVDYNGDGLQDMVVGNYGYFTNGVTAQLALFINIGTTTQPKFKLVDKDYLGFSTQALTGLHPTFGDIDSDGDMDLILGDTDGKLFLYKNSAGAGNTLALNLFSPEYSGIDIGQFAAPQLVDVNQDGLLDLLIGERSGNIDYFENIGTPTTAFFKPDPTAINFGGIDVMIPCCTGYSSPFLSKDTNGDLLLFTGSEKGIIFIYSNISGNLSGNFTLVDSIVTYGNRVNIAFANLDGDIAPELVFGEYSGGINFYDTDSIFNVSVADIINAKSKEIIVFPNPTKGEITFQKKFNEIATLQIFDLSGRQILTKLFNQSPITITPQLKPGVYLVKIKGDGFLINKKLIKQ